MIKRPTGAVGGHSVPPPAAPLSFSLNQLRLSARNAFSIVSSTGPSSAPLASCLMRSIIRLEDRPFVRIKVTRRSLLHRDEDVARQQPIRNLRRLAGIVGRQVSSHGLAIGFDHREVSQQLFGYSLTSPYRPSSRIP